MNPSSEQRLIRQAMQLQQRGEFDQAKDLYKRVLKTTPRHPDALHLYGLACHQQGDHEKAGFFDNGILLNTSDHHSMTPI